MPNQTWKVMGYVGVGQRLSRSSPCMPVTRVPEINVILVFPSNSHRFFSLQGNNTNSGYLGGIGSAMPLV